MVATRRQRKEAGTIDDDDEQDSITNRTRSRSSKAQEPDNQEHIVPRKAARKRGKKASAISDNPSTNTEEHPHSQQPVPAAHRKGAQKAKVVIAPHDNDVQGDSSTLQPPAGKQARKKTGKTLAPANEVDDSVARTGHEASGNSKGASERESEVTSPPAAPRNHRSVSHDDGPTHEPRPSSPVNDDPTHDPRLSSPVDDDPTHEPRPSSPVDDGPTHDPQQSSHVEDESDGGTGGVEYDSGAESDEDNQGDGDYSRSESSSNEEQDDEPISPRPQMVSRKKVSKRPSRTPVQRPPDVVVPSLRRPPVHASSSGDGATPGPQNNNEAGNSGNKRGPLPKAVKDIVDNAILQLKQTLVDTAENYNCGFEKLVSFTVSQLQDKGIGVKEGRARNAFNVFESWCAYKHEERFKDLTKKEKAKFVHAEYLKMINSLPSDKREDAVAKRQLFAEQYEWVEQTNRRVLEQSTNIHRDCKPVIDKLQNLLQVAHSEYGISAIVFMYSSVNSDQATAVRNILGEAPEIKRLIRDNTATLRKMTQTIQHLIGPARESIQGGKKEEMLHVWYSRLCEQDDRDWARKVCQMHLTNSIVHILRCRGQDRDYSTFKIPWSGLTNFLYENKIRIRDLPVTIRLDKPMNIFKTLKRQIVMELANRIHEETMKRTGWTDVDESYIRPSGLKEYDPKPVLFTCDDFSHQLKAFSLEDRGKVPLILTERQFDPNTKKEEFRTFALIKDAISYQREVASAQADETGDDMTEHSSRDRVRDHTSSSDRHGRTHSVANSGHTNATQTSSRTTASRNVGQGNNNGNSRRMGSQPEGSSRPRWPSQEQPASRDSHVRLPPQPSARPAISQNRPRDNHDYPRNPSNVNQREHVMGPSTQRLQDRESQYVVNPRPRNARPVPPFRIPPTGSTTIAGRGPPPINRKRTADDLLSNDSRSLTQNHARHQPPSKRAKVASDADAPRPVSPATVERMRQSFYPPDNSLAAPNHPRVPQGASTRNVQQVSSHSNTRGQVRSSHGAAQYRRRPGSPLSNMAKASTQITIDEEDDEDLADSQTQHSYGNSYNGTRTPMNNRYQSIQNDNDQETLYERYDGQEHNGQRYGYEQYDDEVENDQHYNQQYEFQRYDSSNEGHDVDYFEEESSNEQGSNYQSDIGSGDEIDD